MGSFSCVVLPLLFLSNAHWPMQQAQRNNTGSLKGYPHRRRISIRHELSGRIAIHFNGNSFAQLGMNANSSLVWMGL